MPKVMDYRYKNYLLLRSTESMFQTTTGNEFDMPLCDRLSVHSIVSPVNLSSLRSRKGRNLDPISRVISSDGVIDFGRVSRKVVFDDMAFL